MKLLNRCWVRVILSGILLASMTTAAAILVLSRRPFVEAYVAGRTRTYGIQIANREVIFVIITPAPHEIVATPADPFGGTALYTRYSRDFRLARVWSGVEQNRAFCQRRVEFAVNTWLLVSLLGVPSIPFLGLATLRLGRRWKRNLRPRLVARLKGT